jgi:CHASE2 domain-containing sensor protein
MSYLPLLQSILPKVCYFGYLLLPLLLTAGLRESGVTRQWDLLALDRLLSLRPTEAMEDRIVIVTIDETDLTKEPNQSSISDRNLAKAIDLIAAAKPRVIGVDIIRDGQIDPQLIRAYQQHQNVVGLAKVLPPDQLKSPSGLTPDRIGFGDYEPDVDGAVRRATLAIFYSHSVRVASRSEKRLLLGQTLRYRQHNQSSQPDSKYSFAFQISRVYLQQQQQKIQITRSQLDLGSHSFYPLPSIDNTDRSKYFDILVNYRYIYPTFPQLKLADVLEGKIPNLQDKIILIGYTAATKQDFVNTRVVPNPEINGNIYGVEYHGQIISQLIATTLDGRSFIQVSPCWGDYLWIMIWIVSIVLVLRVIESKTTFWQLLIINITYFASILLSIYFLFIAGWWLSISFTFSTIVIIYLPILVSFYQREQSLIAIAEQRHQAISETFNAIHNGPLQELSLLLQSVKSQSVSLPEIDYSLGKLNQQIRQIGESLQASSTEEIKSILVLGNGERVNLNMPLNEVFYAIADRTSYNSSYSNLVNLKTRIIDFAAVPNEDKLGIDRQRQLCQFLEEAIGNVGKYAEGATRLQLIGKVDGDLYRLTIEDNGRGEISGRIGEGTKQAQRLAASLGGRFWRSPKSDACGVICAIEWNSKF